jgi:hypothetical protein
VIEVQRQETDEIVLARNDGAALAGHANRETASAFPDPGCPGALFVVRQSQAMSGTG